MSEAPGTSPSFPLWVRVTHWLNAALVVLLLLSGLQIFNAHTALYAADDSDPDRVVFSLPAVTRVDPDGRPHYRMVLLGHAYETTWSMTAFQPPLALGGWLAGGRRVHFAAALVLVANGALYLGMMLAGRRKRAVWPRGEDVRGIGASVKAHLKGRFAEPGGAYNPLQKLAYAGVALGLGPLLVATGLAMSPQWDAIFPFWTDMFGGRQMARTIHFLAMAGMVGFMIMHVLLVALSGWPTLRRMLLGGRHG